jgi:plastocyanin
MAENKLMSGAQKRFSRRAATACCYGAVMLAAAWNSSSQAEDLPTFQVVAENGRFRPDTVVVPAGVRFRIRVTNKGPGPEEFESIELRKEKVLAEGVTRTVVFAPLRPGTYTFFGDFHPETAKGRIVAK